MSEDSLAPKKDSSKNQKIIIVIAFAALVISAVAYFNSANSNNSQVSDLDKKIGILLNRTNIDEQYISYLYNKTVSQDNFNQQVKNWAIQEENRTLTLEEKTVQHFGK